MQRSALSNAERLCGFVVLCILSSCRAAPNAAGADLVEFFTGSPVDPDLSYTLCLMKQDKDAIMAYSEQAVDHLTLVLPTNKAWQKSCSEYKFLLRNQSFRQDLSYEATTPVNGNMEAFREHLAKSEYSQIDAASGNSYIVTLETKEICLAEWDVDKYVKTSTCANFLTPPLTGGALGTNIHVYKLDSVIFPPETLAAMNAAKTPEDECAPGEVLKC